MLQIKMDRVEFFTRRGDKGEPFTLPILVRQDVGGLDAVFARAQDNLVELLKLSLAAAEAQLPVRQAPTS